MQDVVFRGCKLDVVSFGFARLARVVFDDCVLTGAEFLEAELGSVVFDGCDLSGADLRGATMRLCELRRCGLDGVVGVERLRGAALEWPAIVENAGVWAAALGIEVLEEERAFAVCRRTAASCGRTGVAGWGGERCRRPRLMLKRRGCAAVAPGRPAAPAPDAQAPRLRRGAAGRALVWNAPGHTGIWVS